LASGVCEAFLVQLPDNFLDRSKRPHAGKFKGALNRGLIVGPHSGRLHQLV
jgi:hypothetical protein